MSSYHVPYEIFMKLYFVHHMQDIITYVNDIIKNKKLHDTNEFTVLKSKKQIHERMIISKENKKEEIVIIQEGYNPYIQIIVHPNDPIVDLYNQLIQLSVNHIDMFDPILKNEILNMLIKYINDKEILNKGATLGIGAGIIYGLTSWTNNKWLSIAGGTLITYFIHHVKNKGLNSELSQSILDHFTHHIKQNLIDEVQLSKPQYKENCMKHKNDYCSSKTPSSPEDILYKKNNCELYEQYCTKFEPNHIIDTCTYYTDDTSNCNIHLIKSNFHVLFEKFIESVWKLPPFTSPINDEHDKYMCYEFYKSFIPNAIDNMIYDMYLYLTNDFKKIYANYIYSMQMEKIASILSIQYLKKNELDDMKMICYAFSMLNHKYYVDTSKKLPFESDHQYLYNHQYQIISSIILNGYIESIYKPEMYDNRYILSKVSSHILSDTDDHKKDNSYAYMIMNSQILYLIICYFYACHYHRRIFTMEQIYDQYFSHIINQQTTSIIRLFLSPSIKSSYCEYAKNIIQNKQVLNLGIINYTYTLFNKSYRGSELLSSFFTENNNSISKRQFNFTSYIKGLQYFQIIDILKLYHNAIQLYF